jgi:hypothetical protein
MASHELAAFSEPYLDFIFKFMPQFQGTLHKSETWSIFLWPLSDNGKFMIFLEKEIYVLQYENYICIVEGLFISSYNQEIDLWSSECVHERTQINGEVVSFLIFNKMCSVCINSGSSIKISFFWWSNLNLDVVTYLQPQYSIKYCYEIKSGDRYQADTILFRILQKTYLNKCCVFLLWSTTTHNSTTWIMCCSQLRSLIFHHVGINNCKIFQILKVQKIWGASNGTFKQHFVKIT